MSFVTPAEVFAAFKHAGDDALSIDAVPRSSKGVSFFTLRILELDDGKRVEFGPGDVVVQRGIAHAWLNEGSEWSQVYFVALGECLLLVS